MLVRCIWPLANLQTRIRSGCAVCHCLSTPWAQCHLSLPQILKASTVHGCVVDAAQQDLLQVWRMHPRHQVSQPSEASSCPLTTVLMHGAGTRVKDHYLNSYRQVFLNILRTQLGRRGVDSGVEGCLHLAQSVDLKQLLPMADAQLTPAEDDFLHGGVGRIGSQLGFSRALSKMQHAISMSMSRPSIRPCQGAVTQADPDARADAQPAYGTDQDDTTSQHPEHQV